MDVLLPYWVAHKLLVISGALSILAGVLALKGRKWSEAIKEAALTRVDEKKDLATDASERAAALDAHDTRKTRLEIAVVLIIAASILLQTFDSFWEYRKMAANPPPPPGLSAEEVAKLISASESRLKTALQNDLSVLRATLNTNTGQLNNLDTRLGQLEARVSALEKPRGRPGAGPGKGGGGDGDDVGPKPSRGPGGASVSAGEPTMEWVLLKLNNLDLRVRKTEGKMGIPLEEEWITVPVILPQEQV